MPSSNDAATFLHQLTIWASIFRTEKRRFSNSAFFEAFNKLWSIFLYIKLYAENVNKLYVVQNRVHRYKIGAIHSKIHHVKVSQRIELFIVLCRRLAVFGAEPCHLSSPLVVVIDVNLSLGLLSNLQFIFVSLVRSIWNNMETVM